MNLARTITIAIPVLLIRCYQLTLSPWLSGCCRFTPSCSAYALEALRRHGLIKGSWLALKRIMRCQPLSRTGDDPVPPQKPIHE